jgi:hypothetical protein
MSKLGMKFGLVAGLLLLAVPMFPQSKAQPAQGQQGQGQAVVTVLPKAGGGAPASIAQQDLKIAVNGRQSSVTNWVSLRGPENKLELVLLIDGSARATLGSQLGDITHFIQSLPANTRIAIAYMKNGRAVMAGPLSADHAQVLRGLHMPGGSPGSNASPYFCLSDLAQHWPSKDGAARREVVMITNGADEYDMRFDANDPYVDAAITDSVRARLVVYSIYWQNIGFGGRVVYEINTGQSRLLQVAEATGGNSYGVGYGNPVSFQPFLEDIARRLQNQYELSFTAQLHGKPDVESLKLKIDAPATQIDFPQQVLVGQAGTAVD